MTEAQFKALSSIRSHEVFGRPLDSSVTHYMLRVLRQKGWVRQSSDALTSRGREMWEQERKNYLPGGIIRPLGESR